MGLTKYQPATTLLSEPCGPLGIAGSVLWLSLRSSKLIEHHGARLPATGVGVLDIVSVYDFDGVDTAKPSIAMQANPSQTGFYRRPARFIRIEKAVEIPDKNQKEGKRKIPVKVGLSNGSVTEILSGLKEGDQVVLQQ